MTTTNLSMEQPANGADVDTWDVPVNANTGILDQFAGGTTTLTVTGQSGVVTLSASQYRSRYIILAGVLTANVNYRLPSGVGGQWVVYNVASGAFTVTISSAGGGGTYVIQPGVSTSVVCDGSNVRISNSNFVTAAANGDASVSGSLTVGSFIVAATPGVSGNRVVNYSQFQPSASSNGYTFLPGGLLFQWGTTGASDGSGRIILTYPLAFPTNVFQVVPSVVGNAGANFTMAWDGSGGLTATNFYTTTASTGNPAGGVSATWTAIGN